MLQNSGYCLKLLLFSYLSSENSPVPIFYLLQAWCLICQGWMEKQKKKAQQILCPCYKTSPNWKTLSQSSKQRYHLDFEWTSKNEIDFKAVFQVQKYCVGWSFSNSCIRVLIFSYADISDKIFIPPIPALCNSKSRISTRLNSPYFGINLVYSIFENVTLP